MLVELGGGTAIGGGIGMIVGGFIGYLPAEAAAGYLYDFAEGTMFVQMPKVLVPSK